MFRYFIEATVIICGILLSLYIDELNTRNRNIETKIELLQDLNQSLDDDFSQIQTIRSILQNSLNLISYLQDDIESNHKILSDQDAVNYIIDIEVAASFFPGMGVYNELISSGSYELVKDSELKRTLFDLYETQKERNYTISLGLDLLQTDYLKETYKEFGIRFEYEIDQGDVYGDRVLLNYDFNEQYYLSKYLI